MNFPFKIKKYMGLAYSHEVYNNSLFTQQNKFCTLRLELRNQFLPFTQPATRLTLGSINVQLIAI